MSRLPRAAYTRVIFAEIERLTAHLGDLGGVCLDTAYNFATYQFRMLRGWTYWLAEKICGSRFFAQWFADPAVYARFIAGNEVEIINRLGKIRCELTETAKIVFVQQYVCGSHRKYGYFKSSGARDINAVGPPARACGLPLMFAKTSRMPLTTALMFRLSFKQRVMWTEGFASSSTSVLHRLT
jgi:Ni,Fe-hydrogenase III large subunit